MSTLYLNLFLKLVSKKNTSQKLQIYESCFGPDVVKQVRQELKEAYAKCSSPPSVGEGLIQRVPSLILANLPQGFESDPATQTITKPTDGAVPENVPQILSHKQMFDNMLKQRVSYY